MPATYEPIATVTATGGSSILVMDSIPQTYTDLVLIASGNTTIDDEFQLRFNSDSGSNYRVLFMYGMVVQSHRLNMHQLLSLKWVVYIQLEQELVAI